MTFGRDLVVLLRKPSMFGKVLVLVWRWCGHCGGLNKEHSISVHGGSNSFLACLEMLKWVWPFMNQYRMVFVQTSTPPPHMHQKLTKHGRFCKQLPTLEESLSITTGRCDLAIATHARKMHKNLYYVFMHFPSMSRNGQVATAGCNGQAFF
jgi:hypothetical protein